jgi:excisionase family DNA binding protein
MSESESPESVSTLEPLLNADEVATLTGFSKQVIYKNVRYGVMPCVRFGKQIRFSPRALREWIDSGGTPSQ